MVMSWPNVPTRARSSGRQPREELLRRRAQQRQVAFHAAGHVEHDDQADRLRRVVEDA